MERYKLANPTYKEMQEMRIGIAYANNHFFHLVDNLDAWHYSPESAQTKFRILEILSGFGYNDVAAAHMRSVFDGTGLDIPDELYSMKDNTRKYYIREMLLLWEDYKKMRGLSYA